ncbi:MAG: hypothetical protein IK095_02075 [Oscillospiraceae bacterium]|nr:hypothetical protein [Oscillospiraceae bacterium]
MANNWRTARGAAALPFEDRDAQLRAAGGSPTGMQGGLGVSDFGGDVGTGGTPWPVGGQIPEGDIALAQSLERSAVPDTGEIAPWQRLPVSAPEISQAYQTLLRYKAGKASLEQRLVEDQEWYRLRQWESMRRKKREGSVEPVSAWLLNSIANKHADAMDNMPRANILPREETDVQEARSLSAIVPVVLDSCEFEETYARVMDDKLISGTGAYGVFWDSRKQGGLGDIDIRPVDLIDLFWEPGICDIQQSRHVFFLSLRDNDLLEQQWPQLRDKLGGPTIETKLYLYDDSIDTSDKSVLVDWYYKKTDESGRTVLHWCQFVAGQTEPLYASENDPEHHDRGWYDHGCYPFVLDPLMRCKGTPAGFGYIDIGKSAQEYIDRGDAAVLQNLLFNARPRHFIRTDGAVNEEEFADVTRDFVHVDGALGQDSIVPIQPTPLNGLYVSILENKVQELKETTGNRDVSNGGTSGGATAAAAIAAMQEAGSKLSRDFNKGSYRAFRAVVVMVIELIRQFYDVPRRFRILGPQGQEEFTAWSNAGIVPQAQGMLADGSESYRLPMFDISVSAEKQSPYSRLAQNELALQLYGAGFFAPENAPAALACLDMMDFDRKDMVVRKVQANGDLQQQLMQAQQMIGQLMAMLGGPAAPGPAPGVAPTASAPAAGEPVPAEEMQALGGTTGGESKITRKARQNIAEATAPR